VVKETLRFSVALPGGLPRRVSPAGGEICGVKIPGGVSASCLSCYFIPDACQQITVSQSMLFVHFSEEIFARAHEFIPDRWLQPDSKSLDTHLVVFSKGVRSCPGIK